MSNLDQGTSLAHLNKVHQSSLAQETPACDAYRVQPASAHCGAFKCLGHRPVLFEFPNNLIVSNSDSSSRELVELSESNLLSMIDCSCASFPWGIKRLNTALESFG